MQGTNLIELNKSYRYQTLSLVNRTLSNIPNKDTRIFVVEYRKNHKKVTPRGRTLKKLNHLRMAFLQRRQDEQCAEIQGAKNAGN
ncbi:hypothetical protein ACOMXT_001751 [Providencia rettgeri]